MLLFTWSFIFFTIQWSHEHSIATGWLHSCTQVGWCHWREWCHLLILNAYCRWGCSYSVLPSYSPVGSVNATFLCRPQSMLMCQKDHACSKSFYVDFVSNVNSECESGFVLSHSMAPIGKHFSASLICFRKEHSMFFLFFFADLTEGSWHWRTFAITSDNNIAVKH